MAKQNDTGVYKLQGGNWAFRYCITPKGKKKGRISPPCSFLYFDDIDRCFQKQVY